MIVEILTTLLFRWYTKSHEWLDVDTDTQSAKLGISKYAADQLGDIVHVDLPEDGMSLSQGESIVSLQIIKGLTCLQCAIESVKTAADVYMPCDGKITKINTNLEDEP